MDLTLAPQIKTVIPISNSIFSNTIYDFTPIQPSQLDILFSANYGERKISPLLDRLISSYIEPAPIDELQEIGKIIVTVYGKKWDRLKSIYTIEYDKIHNYLDEFTENVAINATEEEILASTTQISDTDNDVTKNIRTDNLSKGGTLTTVKSDTGNEADTTYGFNSSTPVNTDGIQTTLGSDSTETRALTDTGTQQNDFTSTKEKDILKDVDNTTTLTTENIKVRSYKHQGNIGNLTTQELIRQDIKLWEWNFVETILNDVKDLLTLQIYC